MCIVENVPTGKQFFARNVWIGYLFKRSAVLNDLNVRGLSRFVKEQIGDISVSLFVRDHKVVHMTICYRFVSFFNNVYGKTVRHKGYSVTYRFDSRIKQFSFMVNVYLVYSDKVVICERYLHRLRRLPLVSICIEYGYVISGKGSLLFCTGRPRRVLCARSLHRRCGALLDSVAVECCCACLLYCSDACPFGKFSGNGNNPAAYFGIFELCGFYFFFLLIFLFLGRLYFIFGLCFSLGFVFLFFSRLYFVFSLCLGLRLIFLNLGKLVV